MHLIAVGIPSSNILLRAYQMLQNVFLGPSAILDEELIIQVLSGSH